MAKGLQPKLTRVALVGADVEFSRNAIDGARENAKAMGFEIVYERSYPVGADRVHRDRAGDAGDQSGHRLCGDAAARHRRTDPRVERGPVQAEAVTAAHSSVCSSPAIKQQLGPLANGLVNNEFYIPAPSLQFTGTKEFLDEYQKRAAGAGVDPLGYTYPPYAYAAGQILAKAVTETKSLDDDKLAAYIRARTPSTPSSARSRSGRTASGRSRASSTPSSRTSAAATSRSSRT